MNMVEIICKKRDKEKLSQQEIEYFISNYTSGDIPDYQASALAMAILLNGMDEEEISLLDEHWEDNEPMKVWNERMSKYFEGSKKTALILNGRIIEPSSFTELTLSSLVKIDEQITLPLRQSFPNTSLVALLPFIHDHLSELDAQMPVLPAESSFLLSSENPSAVLSFTAILDPLSILAQRTIAIFNELQQYIPISYRILLVPQTDYSELPLKRFYRYVLNSDQMAVWRNLPQHYIYTMTTEVPYKWNVVAYYAEADLDNLRVASDDTYILAQYMVDGIIVEGSAYKQEEPASGVMLQLTKHADSTVVSDTVVMNNRGYWQLRGDMGLYEISVSDESPEVSLMQDGTNIDKKLVYLWNNMDETVSLEIGKKEKKESPSFLDKMKSSLFGKSKTTLNSLAETEEEFGSNFQIDS